MGKKIPKAICLYGAQFMRQQVQSLQTQFDGVQTGKDIEYVHQMRVASRRLHNGLDLFKECLPDKKSKVWLENIRNITHALGDARDMDIQIEELPRLYEADLDPVFKPGYTRLLLRLKQNRTKAQKKINKTLFKLQESQTLEAMLVRFDKMLENHADDYLFTPALYEKSCSTITENLTVFLSYQDYIHDPEMADKLHAMRIAGKHLRYTMEVFAPIYNSALNPFIAVMKDIQDQLGEIHDNDVWVAWLPKFILQEQARIEDYFGNAEPLQKLLPGLHHLMEDRQQARDETYHTFLALWDSINAENVWSELKKLIHAPLDLKPLAPQDADPPTEDFEITQANSLEGAESDAAEEEAEMDIDDFDEIIDVEIKDLPPDPDPPSTKPQ